LERVLLRQVNIGSMCMQNLWNLLLPLRSWKQLSAAVNAAFLGPSADQRPLPPPLDIGPGGPQQLQVFARLPAVLRDSRPRLQRAQAQPALPAPCRAAVQRTERDDGHVQGGSVHHGKLHNFRGFRKVHGLLKFCGNALRSPSEDC
jgi:hypothetical protein